MRLSLKVSLIQYNIQYTIYIFLLSFQSSKTKEEFDSEVIEGLTKIKEFIVQNSSTAFRENELYDGQDLLAQLQAVLESYEQHKAIIGWLEDVVNDMVNEGSADMAKKFVAGVLEPMKTVIANAPFMVLGDNQILNLQYFIKTPTLATLFLECNAISMSSGGSVQDTIIGNILSKSCLPISDFSSCEFFQEPSKQPASVHNATEGKIWAGLEVIHEIGQVSHSVFIGLHLPLGGKVDLFVEK